jgi:hypothetical protein
MGQDQEILQELKIINKKLDKFTHPIKGAWYNFSSGMFRSLGYIFGTAIITSLILYFLSKSNFGQSISKWFEFYQPTNYQLSVPSPGQP